VRKLKAIVYGVGAMGSIIARLLLEKDVEIVGAIARSPNKIGRDLGEVAGLGFAAGVTVTADARPVLAQCAPDIAVVCVSSYLSTMREHFRVCLEHGVNVVTTEEESIYPWTTAPDLAAELDRLAKENGVTLAASGAQDVFWINLVATLMGAAHRIDAVAGRCSWNVDDYGPEVAAVVRVGDTRAKFDRHLREHGRSDFVVRATLETLIARAGLRIGSVKSSVVPLLAEEDTASRSLGRVIPRERVLGVLDTTTIRTADGPTFSLEMAGRVYREGESDLNEWLIKGEPELHLRNDHVPTQLATCATVVNRIPDGIAAEPGLVTLDRLPQLRYRPAQLALPA
jgi:2,4-diaminopentanoate dehydrogenase